MYYSVAHMKEIEYNAKERKTKTVIDKRTLIALIVTKTGNSIESLKGLDKATKVSLEVLLG